MIQLVCTICSRKETAVDPHSHCSFLPVPPPAKKAKLQKPPSKAKPSTGSSSAPTNTASIFTNTAAAAAAAKKKNESIAANQVKGIKANTSKSVKEDAEGSDVDVRSDGKSSADDHGAEEEDEDDDDLNDEEAKDVASKL
jgi:hypothetical protein